MRSNASSQGMQERPLDALVAFKLHRGAADATAVDNRAVVRGVEVAADVDVDKIEVRPGIGLTHGLSNARMEHA